jgi:hypothetical protein
MYLNVCDEVLLETVVRPHREQFHSAVHWYKYDFSQE